ncbi:MAG: phospho-N-acetylmuramoyl-pentapeptide-transferase [Acidimicrobiales bacterium]
MIALLLAGGTSIVISLIGTPVLIRWLHANGIGQQIREDGPGGHHIKAGTPTMGGLMIVGGAVLGYAGGHLRTGAVFTRSGLLVIFATVATAAVGLADDWIKVRRERSLGLNKRGKIAGQLVVSLTFAYLALEWAGSRTNLSFTRFDSFAFGEMPDVVWIVWVAFLLIATSNAVNIADGLDGLAAGSSTFAFSTLAIMAFWQFRHFDIYRVPQALDIAMVAMGLTGGCIGFLWWNAAPARIFMGDTGSLGIGAGMAALCVVMNLHLLLPVVAGLFVIITMSDIIQIISFRFFHRRVFRMAPLHHHFELMGWPETTVIIRFWILAGLCTALALGIFYADFLAVGGID